MQYFRSGQLYVDPEEESSIKFADHWGYDIFISDGSIDPICVLWVDTNLEIL